MAGWVNCLTYADDLLLLAVRGGASPHVQRVGARSRSMGSGKTNSVSGATPVGVPSGWVVGSWSRNRAWSSLAPCYVAIPALPGTSG